MANILRLARRAQAPVVDFSKKEFTKVLSLQDQVSNFVPKIKQFFEDPVGNTTEATNSTIQAAVDAVVPPAPAPQPPRAAFQVAALLPIAISGFYKVTGEREATFYSVTDWPITPITTGWGLDPIPGLRGLLIVKTISNKAGKEPEGDYTWSFTIQSDMDQYVPGPEYVTASMMYPPGRMSTMRGGPIYGYYEVVKSVPTFYFTTPPSQGAKAGWVIEGLPTLPPQRLIDYNPSIKERQVDARGIERMILRTTATLEAIDKTIPPNAAPVYVKGFPAIIKEPDPKVEFTPGRFYGVPQQEASVAIPQNIKIGNAAPLRELNEYIGDFPEPMEMYQEVKDRGLSQGSVISLHAIGPQDEFLYMNDFTKSQWNLQFKQHSNFVMYHRSIPIGPPHPFYQGQVVQMELRPTELGHLLSNMYLKLDLPALPGGGAYSPQGARALIKQVDLIVNETVVETLYDDWYIIRDQVFLDADEQIAMQLATNITSAGGPVVIPLEFFFCRRFSHQNKSRERLRRPYFPLCAMWNQKLYIRFTFQPSTWWCNAASVVDFSNPQLITEEILLENKEKLYYQSTPLKYIVNRVQREAGLTFTRDNTQLQLTANFPVQTLAWFFRNKDYEDPTDSNYSDSRYNFGYTTQYIRSGINLTFPSGQTNFVDVINTAKITLNNIDILSTFQGSLYYSFKQPMEHGLSIPSKNIYTYSFGLSPKEYNQGGYLNFAKLNSQTTTLSLTFNPSYASQIVRGFNLYMYYYGYTVLQFQGGFASLPYL